MPDIDMIIGGVRYDCKPRDCWEADWVFPIGDTEYPPEKWYCAVTHDLTGKANANGYKHSGIDINLDVSPWGDIERELGLSIRAIAPGVITYSTPAWSGVPMVVMRHMHDGRFLWVRYAHIAKALPMTGLHVCSGFWLGGFADWPKKGDHLHLDMALDPFEREWLDPNICWIHPVPILKAHLNPDEVDAMLRKGD